MAALEAAIHPGARPRAEETLERPRPYADAMDRARWMGGSSPPMTMLDSANSPIPNFALELGGVLEVIGAEGERQEVAERHGVAQSVRTA